MNEKELADGVLLAVKSFVQRNFDSVLGRLKALESAPIPVAVDGKDGKDGSNGVDGGNGIDGRDGINGVDGEQGVEGPEGKPGPIGPPGLNGLDGKNGDIGPHGIAGVDGRDGRDGEAGVPGRDAIQLDVMPEIDPEKRYQRGRYAKHMGGLWRSFEATDGMKGWENVVDGIANISVNQDPADPRVFNIALSRSSGAIETKDFRVPMMIWRGVYAEGMAYEVGDTTTSGGSLWHCNEQTAERPGEGKAWTLVAKRGRDGKDADVPALKTSHRVRLS